MLDRGTAAFTLATVAVALTVLAFGEWLLFFQGYWALLIGPAVALLLSGGVWLALRRICTRGGHVAHVAALGGIVLLCVWSVLGMSLGAMAAIPSVLLLMVAHAIVPSPR